MSFLIRPTTSAARLASSSCTCRLAPRRQFSSSPSSNAASTSSSSSSSSSKYTLSKGLVLNGLVIKAGVASQTTTVSVERIKTDHKTLKEFKTHAKYLIHDPSEQCVVGDRVEIRNCRPVSKRKRFELVRVVKESRQRESVLSDATGTTANASLESASA